MDARSIALLEFPQVRERLADATSFPPSRRLAEALEPSSDPVIVARGLDETDQARALLAERRGVGIGAAHDIGPAIERAARGGRLDPSQFLELADTLDAAARLADVARRRSAAAAPRARPRAPPAARPSAPRSPAASTRSASCSTRRRRAWAGCGRRSASPTTGCGAGSTRSSGSELGGALQEPIITLRNGRYVVPVKAEARGRVKGIVHDASGSGQTLFVEPLVAVELGNAWREAQVAEQEEIERILDELSALVAANAEPLRETLDALARFDFWAAKAQLAAELDGIRAETTNRAEIVLLGARHPGLTGRVVPIDVRLGDGYTALVVTGPNTGGKTVTLRTLGLLALMHQAGLHVPADAGSRLPIFRDVFADIGDEQSIAQSLSTFSGHLRSIIRIVEAAGPGTLVLLDELGAGTDPTEGSALAQALLDHFIRAGALVAATTHYAELKAYAHTTPGARNASVEFDLETLSPTYRLTIGLPGGSQAFAIAERLGLDGAIVADARSRLSENERAFEETLARIRETEGETSEALDRARAAELRAAEALREADEERRRARQERDELVRSARNEAERLVADLRDDVTRDPPDAGARDGHRAVARRGRRPGRGPAGRPPGEPGRSRPPRNRPRTSGASASGREAGAAAGRAGSPRSSGAASGRRSRPAGCGSPSTSATSRSLRPVPSGERRAEARVGLRNRVASAGPRPERRLVARPARRARRRGARGAGPLPRRRRAGRPGQGPDHPRQRDGRAARRGPDGGRQPSARQGRPRRRARRGRRRRDDRHALGGARRAPPRATVSASSSGRTVSVCRSGRAGRRQPARLGRRLRDRAELRRGEDPAPGLAEREELAAVEVGRPRALGAAGTPEPRAAA